MSTSASLMTDLVGGCAWPANSLNELRPIYILTSYKVDYNSTKWKDIVKYMHLYYENKENCCLCRSK